MEKQYTLLREPMNLQYGFNMTNTVSFSVACIAYERESPEEREVLVTNLSGQLEKDKNERRVARGNCMLDVISLCAGPGDLLEIKIEGVDESAQKFAAELKRGLNEEGYLREEFLPRFRAVKHSETDMADLRPLYKRDYKS